VDSYFYPLQDGEGTKMLGIHDYWLFILAGILLNLTPGQDTAFIIGRSLTGTVRAGIAAALGVNTGSCVHTLAAAAGLSVLLVTFPKAFLAVKLAGAAYLIYLGTRLLLTRKEPPAAETHPGLRGISPWSAYTQGILTNVLNPKVALFFLAFLPQFINPLSPHKTLAFLALGATFISTGTIWCLVLAIAAARLRGFFAANPSVRTLIDRITGSVFVLLGLRLAWSR
jgi:threonine/homoserine/homoserine lactone efflux protein